MWIVLNNGFDSELNKIIISYRDRDDSNMGKVVKTEVSDSGNSITVESTRLVFDASNGYNWQNKISSYIPGSNKTVLSHFAWVLTRADHLFTVLQVRQPILQKKTSLEFLMGPIVTVKLLRFKLLEQLTMPSLV